MKRERKQSEDSELDEGKRKVVKEDRLIPKKKDYRMRAHINPLNTTPFPYPSHHSFVDWKGHYPLFYNGSQEDNEKAYCNTVEHPSFYEHPRTYPLNGTNVSIIDVGCGYGGLLFGLAPLFPDKLILGMEIRDKLVNFVSEKVRGYRIQNPGQYNNISVVRTNTMRHLCQYFPKESLEKIFICFPDPHFKAKNYRRRVINTGFLSEYAFLLKPKGRLYCITDVLELHEWHMDHLRAHEMFQEVADPDDPCVKVMVNKTEEGQKVERNKGDKYWGIFERKSFE